MYCYSFTSSVSHVCQQVFLYRAGIVTSAACFTLGALAAYVPSDNPLSSTLRSALDPLAAVGAGSLGLSLVLVHMYVTPIKRFMQVCFSLSPTVDVFVCSEC